MEDLDVEALQAQIDLSNSIAYDIVSSWMSPGTATSSQDNPESVSNAIARELEEHAKRPPRLGLGAAISKSSVLTAREAARLKAKLAGGKRARDEARDGTPNSGNGRVGEDGEEDDDSRSAAILIKKVKLNGIGSHALGAGKKNKGKAKALRSVDMKEADTSLVIIENDDSSEKKGKQKHDNDNSAQHKTLSPVKSTPTNLNPFVLPTTPIATASVINLISSSPAQSTAAATSPKKKKRKKNKANRDGEETAPAEDDDEWHGFSNHSPLTDSVDLPKGNSPDLSAVQPSTPPYLTRKMLGTTLTTPSSITDLTSPIRPTPSPSPFKGLSLLAGNDHHLLNLHTPPPPQHDKDYHKEQSNSPKKKRPKRRRGKGRKSRDGKEEAT